MTLRGPHVPIYWMRFIAPPPAWKKKKTTPTNDAAKDHNTLSEWTKSLRLKKTFTNVNCVVFYTEKCNSGNY